MLMLSETREVVIGVDTHRDTHTAAVIDVATTGVLATYTIQTTVPGYQDLLTNARQHGRVREWAIEGTPPMGWVWSECCSPPGKSSQRRTARNGLVDAAERTMRSTLSAPVVKRSVMPGSPNHATVVIVTRSPRIWWFVTRQ
jgi:hypothetical protein